MAAWKPCPYRGEYRFDGDRLALLWPRLHQGDAEPPPASAEVMQAWRHYHEGEFEDAYRVGLAAGPAGMNVANKAACMHATYLEPDEKCRQELFQEIARRAGEHTQAHPDDAGGWFLLAYALGRYSQGISVAKALAFGLGGKVRQSLERTIRLQPLHADAHVALGTFHAEVIDKVGALIGAMTYGASRETGLRMLDEGLRLNPDSAIALIECANSLVMLGGEARTDEATRLYEKAAACEPLDAVERLNVERARRELQD